MRHRFPRALPPLLLGLALSLAACGDATGPVGTAGPGRVSFQYSGPVSGAFQAEGNPPATNPSQADWAAGERDAHFDELLVYATRVRTDGRHDAVALLVPDDGPRSYTVSDDCTTACADVKLYLGSGATPGQAAEWVCSLRSGTVRVVEALQGRVRGEFSGDGTCQNPAQPNQPLVIVQAGQFDVPLTDAL